MTATACGLGAGSPADDALMPKPLVLKRLPGMRYLVLVTDYDSTIATGGTRAVALAAIERLRESDGRAILLTGRRLDDLLTVFLACVCSIMLWQRTERSSMRREPASKRFSVTPTGRVSSAFEGVD